jgi:hypothetical protein
MVEEHLGSGRERLEHARPRRGARGDLVRDLRLELLVYSAQQVALAVEVVVERAAGDAGGADDLLGTDAGVAALGEQRPRRLDEGGPGCLRALILGPA